MKNIRLNVLIFFLRIATRKEIKRLKRRINYLLWQITVEGNKNPLIIKEYQDTSHWINVKETTLRGLVYV